MQKDRSNGIFISISNTIKEYPSLFVLALATLVITIITTISSSPLPTVAYFSAGTPVPSATPSTTGSPSPSISPEPSATPEASPSPTVSPEPSIAPSPSPSASPAVTPSPSPSPSVTPDPSASPEVSPSPTVSPEPSVSPSPSPSASPVVTPSPSSSSESSSDGGGSNDPGSNTLATPPVCSAATPTTVTNLRITNQGTNSVTLNWDVASPVSHYALIFTRLSDGEKYGAANIGNTTSYVITGISGQAQYTFEVFGVNDCKPGERASVTSTVVAGPVLSARPTGGDGQVLGASIDLTEEHPEPSLSPSPKISPTPTHTPEVLGATTEICTQGSPWLPVIFLLVEALLLSIVEYNYRTDKTYLRYYLTAGIALAGIGFFYLLGGCNCDPASWQGMICQWFWLVAAVLGVVTRTSGLLLTKKK